MRIQRKLLAVYLSLAIVPLVLIGATTYALARQTLIREVLDNLSGVTSRMSAVLTELSERNEITATTLAKEAAVIRVFEAATSTAEARMTLGLPTTLARMQRIDPHLRTLMVLDADGKVVAATDPLRVGDEYADEDFFIRGKAAAVSNAYYRKASGEVLERLAAPIHDAADAFVGVVVDEHYPKIVRQLIADPLGLGETGEIVLVKEDALEDAVFVMPTRHDPNAAFVRKIQEDSHDNAISRAIGGSSGAFDDVVDYRGEPVFSSTRFLENLHLVLQVKIDRAEALKPMRNIALGTLLAILLTLGFVVVITIAVSKSIAAPIVKLTNITNQISMGKLDVKLDSSEADDEIGELHRTFERILVSLKLAMRETNKGALSDDKKK